MFEFLEKIILEKPKPINIKDIENSEESLVLELNDKLYRFDKSNRGWLSWITGIFLILAWLFILWGKFDTNNFWPNIIVTMIFGLPGLFLIIYGFVAPKKEMVYNRLEGFITVTHPIRKSFDIPFKTGVGIKARTHFGTASMEEHLSFSVSKEKPRKGGTLTTIFPVGNYWSFTVWYMDKNRPLPPGTAFDPYRQRDFERRKAEGFPKPLYPSNIPTPEATKEQQAERKRIGGW